MCLAGIAGATTYVVDVNGGAGVDFTDIPPAIAAASAGDIILVHPGSYSSFTLSTGLSIVGSPGTSTLDIQVANIVSGPHVALASLSFRKLSISACAVPVLVNDLVKPSSLQSSGVATIEIDACADVRLHGVQVTNAQGFTGRTGLEASSSRVEITASAFHAGQGVNNPFATGVGGPGGIGISCLGDSDVHVSLSSIFGGQGGNSLTGFGYVGDGGNGGSGIQVADSAKVLVTGRPSDAVNGGSGGFGPGNDGVPASGLLVAASGTARVSAVTFHGGSTPPLLAPGISGPADVVTPIDPSLEVSGTLSAGQTVTFTFHGTAGDSARLRLGRQAVVLPSSAYEDQLTDPLRSYNLGILPFNGETQKQFTIPNSLPHGFILVFQGTALGVDGVSRFTQSVPIIVK
jgi:hypothetical protein